MQSETNHPRSTTTKNGSYTQNKTLKTENTNTQTKPKPINKSTSISWLNTIARIWHASWFDSTAKGTINGETCLLDDVHTLLCSPSYNFPITHAQLVCRSLPEHLLKASQRHIENQHLIKNDKKKRTKFADFIHASKTNENRQIRRFFTRVETKNGKRSIRRCFTRAEKRETVDPPILHTSKKLEARNPPIFYTRRKT